MEFANLIASLQATVTSYDVQINAQASDQQRYTQYAQACATKITDLSERRAETVAAIAVLTGDSNGG